MLNSVQIRRAPRRWNDPGLLRRFARDRGGNVAIIASIVALPIFMVFGAAIDYARIVHARTQMMAAVDAAALAGGRMAQVDPDALQTIADRTFVANMSYVKMEANFNVDARYLNDGAIVRVSATGFLPATVTRALGREHYRIDVTSEVTRFASGGLEVVMVLDNTGSMAGSRIYSLRKAALRLVDILLPGDAPSEATRVGLTPFVTGVNIRSNTLPGFEDDPEAFSWDWIDVDGAARYNGRALDGAPAGHEPSGRWVLKPQYAENERRYVCSNSQIRAGRCFQTGERRLDAPYTANYLALYRNIANATTLGAGWRGCVEARPGGLDMLDVPPGAHGTSDYATEDTRWTPWFWTDEPGHTGHTNNYALDWIASSLWERQEYVGKYHDGSSLANARSRIFEGTPQKNVNSKIVEYGPNKACPRPIVPLTNRKSLLVEELEYMRPLHGSGTVIPTGLIWGLRVLSPEPPYTQGAAFDEPGVRKVLILLTDGENLLYADSGGQDYNLSDYTPYGFLVENRLGLSQVSRYAFRDEMNRRLASLCERIKDKNVTIYTIMLEMGSNNGLWRLFRDCASRPEYAFAASNANLESVFAAIGGEITVSSLRVSK